MGVVARRSVSVDDPDDGDDHYDDDETSAVVSTSPKQEPSDGGEQGGGGSGAGREKGAVMGWIRRFVRVAKRREDETVPSWLLRCFGEVNGMADEQPPLRSFLTSLAVAIMLVALRNRRQRKRRQQRGLLAASASASGASYRSAADAPLSLLYRSADRGEVQSALLGGAGRDSVVYYRLKGGGSAIEEASVGGWKKSTIPSSVAKDLIDTLSRRCDDVSALPDSISSRLATPVLAAIPFVYLFFLYRVLKETATGLSSGDKKEENLRMLTDHTSTRITFQDVAGMPQVVAEIGEVVRYLSNPQAYQAVGARPPRAILLHGPPGSGKTLLAQAVAGQANVPFFACSASEFVEVYVGRGAARVRALFSQAREAAVRGRSPRPEPNSEEAAAQDVLAQLHSTWSSIFQSLLPWIPSLSPSSVASSTPLSSPPPAWNDSAGSQYPCRPAASILFIDELDALAKSRMSSGSNDEREQTLNQLLTEMDGFASRDEERESTVIVIAATNRVDVLDPAILRRFDRQIHVGYPSTPRDRRDILMVHAKRVRCGVDVDWDRVASDSRTLGCSGADLAILVNEAALLAVREGSPVIQQEQLDHATRRIQQMKWRQDRGGDVFLNLNNAGIR